MEFTVNAYGIIVNFEHISHPVLVFAWLTLNNLIADWDCFKPLLSHPRILAPVQNMERLKLKILIKNFDNFLLIISTFFSMLNNFLIALMIYLSVWRLIR